MFCSKTINSTGVTVVNTLQRIYNIKGSNFNTFDSMELSVLEVLCSMLLTLFNRNW